MITTRAISEGVRQWLEENGFDVNRPDLRAYLNAMGNCEQSYRIRIIAPRTLAIFRPFIRAGPVFWGGHDLASLGRIVRDA